MADYEVIEAVSQTLQDLLTEGMQAVGANPPVAQVVDLLQPGATNDPRATLFLYEVVEDPSVRNRPPVLASSPSQPGSVLSSKPPMGLLLRYMVTPWSGDWQTDQQIIGRVLQVFYDHAIISGPRLRGVLANTNEAIKMTLAPLSLEDRSRVWYAVQQPYRLSLTYEARVVHLDSREARQVPPVRELERRRAEALP